jgi:hypothetical protein
MADPGLDSFQHQDRCLIEVQAVHPHETVPVCQARHFLGRPLCLLLTALQPVLQGEGIVGHLPPLGQGVTGVEHADDAAHEVLFQGVTGNHLFVAVTHIVDGLSHPGLGQPQQRGDLLPLDAEFAGDRDDGATIARNVPATTPPLRDLVSGS